MSKRTRLIQFRVNENEFLRIKNNVQATGHSTISAYLRDLALSKGLILETKVIETNKLVHDIFGMVKLSRCIPLTAFRAMRSLTAEKSTRQSHHLPNAASKHPMDPER